MALSTLTVHDTGPDGDSCYELVIGQDISVEDARELITRSGGHEVYATHHYENGRRVENFVSKAFYSALKASTDSIPASRTLTEIQADIAFRLGPQHDSPASETNVTRSWWRLWR